MGTINKILKERDLILEADNDDECRKIHLYKTEKIENVLYEWFCNKRSRNFAISGSNMQEMALKMTHKHRIENFNVSIG